MSTDDLFGELNDVSGILESDTDNPDALKPGSYPAIISGIRVAKTKAGDKIGATTTVVLDKERFEDEEEGKRYGGRKLSNWQQLPTKAIVVASQNDNLQAQRTVHYFQKWMDSLGFSPEDRSKLSQDLFDSKVGEEVIVTIKFDRNGFSTIADMVLDNGTYSNDVEL